MGLLRFIFAGLFFIVFGVKLCAQNALDNLYLQSKLNFKSGNYAEALNNNIQALKIIEGEGNCGMLAYGNIEVGRMYYFLHDRRLALQYFYRSLRFSDSCNVDSLKQKTFYNIGVIYTELGKADSALFFLNKATKALEKTPNNYSDLSKANAVLADLYLNRIKNYVLAQKYIIDAENYADKTDDLELKGFVQIKYSIFYRLIKNYPLAIKHAKIALEMYGKKGAVENKMYALYVLAGNLALNGDTNAFEVYQKLLVLKDSVFRTETANKIADYKTLYETEKKQKENDLLLQKNKVNQLEIDSKNKTIIGLLFSILLIVLFVFWRISVINLKKKQKELESQQKLQFERERISRDLHDNVGAQLSYLITNIDWMLEHPDAINTEESEKRLGSLRDAGKQAILTLRQTIWALNNKQLSIEEFSDKLKQYALKMIEFDKTIRLRFTEQIDMNSNLSPGVALNLFRVCQEAFNNSLVHSKCKLIEMSFASNEISLIIFEISDDGIGFDPENAERQGHYGIQNMKFRSKESGAELYFQSVINTGTKIRLEVTRQ